MKLTSGVKVIKPCFQKQAKVLLYTATLELLQTYTLKICQVIAALSRHWQEK